MKTNSTKNNKNKDIYSTTIENKQGKNIAFYLLFFCFVILIFFWALSTSNVLLAVIVILFTLLYWQIDRQENELPLIEVNIKPEEIQIGEETFSLKKDFSSFELIKKGQENYLRLDLKNRWRSPVFLPIEEKKIEKVKQTLLANGLVEKSKGVENFFEELRNLIHW